MKTTITAALLFLLAIALGEPALRAAEQPAVTETSLLGQVEVVNAGFSPDGQWLLTQDSRPLTTVWRADHDGRFAVWTNFLAPWLSFTGDGRKLVRLTGGTSRPVNLTAAGKADEYFFKLRQLAVLGQDAKAVTAQRFGTLNLASREAVLLPFDPATNLTFTTALSPDSSRAFLGILRPVRIESGGASYDGFHSKARWLDLRKQSQSLLETGGDALSRVAFSHTGRFLLGSLCQPSVQEKPHVVTGYFLQPKAALWDLDTGRELGFLQKLPAPVVAAVFLPGDRQLLTLHAGQAFLWELETGRSLRRFPVGNAVFSPDWRRLYGGGSDGKVTVWNLETGEKLATLEGHRKNALVTDVSADGKRLLSTSPDGDVRLWDTGTRKELLVLQETAGDHAQAIFSPDQRQILVFGRHGAKLLRSVGWGQR
jgi:WD40 repeat protein